jgi:hypothetical protein
MTMATEGGFDLDMLETMDLSPRHRAAVLSLLKRAVAEEQERCSRDPLRLTPEEREVIAKAQRWRQNENATTSAELVGAVDALPKPAPSLVERLREHAGSEECVSDRALGLLLEAAAALERLGAK